jgi:hypothetical protein
MSYFPEWPQTIILPLLASQVAKITSMGHMLPAVLQALIYSLLNLTDQTWQISWTPVRKTSQPGNQKNTSCPFLAFWGHITHCLRTTLSLGTRSPRLPPGQALFLSG